MNCRVGFCGGKMAEEEGGYGWSPIGAPPHMQRGDHWRHFDNSIDALSFGFVATAVLISMFLVMAIFERFLTPAPSPLSATINAAHPDLESQTGFARKQTRHSPNMTVYSCGVSVLMPGNDIPTFIGRPSPVPCPPKRASLECDTQAHHLSIPTPIAISASS